MQQSDIELILLVFNAVCLAFIARGCFAIRDAIAQNRSSTKRRNPVKECDRPISTTG
jgi:hypothetical protein